MKVALLVRGVVKNYGLLCLFMRNATSNNLPIFLAQNPELTAQEKALLPVLFTFETIKRSKSFFTLRSVSVNTMVWQLASADKIERFKKRINTFWTFIRNSLEEAVARGELNASPQQQAELTQGIIFYLTGSLTQFESQLINPDFLGQRRETCYRHLAKLMTPYHWQLPLTRGLFDSLELQTKVFFDKHYRAHMTCAACNRLASAKSNCASDCTREQTLAG